jgi:phosphate starvation-inducible PhoH-like protein
MARKSSSKIQLSQYRVEPKTENQKIYKEALDDVTIKYLAVSGIAGSGKSLLLAQRAAQGIVKEEFDKIYVCRSVTPIKGESIGYLKGDMESKMLPWLAPALQHLEKFFLDLEWCVNSGIIEFLPLAQIRGRSLDRSIVICEEAQNMSLEILECLLTRVDSRSKLILNGDFKQNDKSRSDMTDFERVCRALDGMDGFEWVKMGPEDVVRNKQIVEILDRLEKFC